MAREDKRGRSILLANRAVCYRRAAAVPELNEKQAMDLLDKALEDLEASLRLFPRFPRAIFRRAVVLLERGDTFRASKAFDDLYRIDRDWPNLDNWLVRTHALLKRAKKSGGSSGKSSFLHAASAFSKADAKQKATTTAAKDKETEFIQETNHYKCLGVTSDATAKQLKSAYRMTSLRWHPDRKGIVFLRRFL